MITALISMACGTAVLFLALSVVEIPGRPAVLQLLELSTPPARPSVGAGALLERIGSSRLTRVACGSPRLRRRLVSAGQPFSFDVLAGSKVICGSATFLAFLVFGTVVPLAALLSPLAGLAGFLGPDFLLSRKARRRLDRIVVHVPDLVELLVATTEAGLSPVVAFRRSAGVMGPPLGHELREAVRQVDLGMPWRSALEQLVERTGDPSLRRLTVALTRSHRLGTSVALALRSLAEELRRERRSRAEELARRAPVKMLFPLVFLILPAFLLLTVGPVVLATIRSLR